MTPPTTVLITGASGLLGSAIVQRLQQDGLKVIGLCHRNPHPGLIPVDLSDRNAVLDLARLEWDAIINCAAYRSPDFCELHQESARLLNAAMPEWLARMASARGASFAHISTDYVFPGTRPPYAEEAPVEPLNFYGRTKVMAEAAIREAHPEALVVRVPALYGAPPPPAVSSLLKEGLEGAMGSGPLELDDTIVRFPTHVDDVAVALSFALARAVTGILHVSAGEAATRYVWTCRLAGWLGRDSGRITSCSQVPDRPAPRPINSRLSTDRLVKLGIPVPLPFSDVMPDLLKKIGL